MKIHAKPPQKTQALVVFPPLLTPKAVLRPGRPAPGGSPAGGWRAEVVAPHGASGCGGRRADDIRPYRDGNCPPQPSGQQNPRIRQSAVCGGSDLISDDAGYPHLE